MSQRRRCWAHDVRTGNEPIQQLGFGEAILTPEARQATRQRHVQGQIFNRRVRTVLRRLMDRGFEKPISSGEEHLSRDWSKQPGYENVDMGKLTSLFGLHGRVLFVPRSVDVPTTCLPLPLRQWCRVRWGRRPPLRRAQPITLLPPPPLFASLLISRRSTLSVVVVPALTSTIVTVTP